MGKNILIPDTARRFDSGEYSISDYAKQYKKDHPVYRPQGSTTVRSIPVFTEEEVRAMPEVKGDIYRGAGLVSRIPIAVKEPDGIKWYYELNPKKGGKKGTEVDWEAEGVSAPPLPEIKAPEITFPKINFPKLKFPDFGISAATKGIAGIFFIFIAIIIFLVALGYSGLGGSVGRVSEHEYKKHRR